jgi:hypothetical protein
VFKSRFEALLNRPARYSARVKNRTDIWRFGIEILPRSNPDRSALREYFGDGRVDPRRRREDLLFQAFACRAATVAARVQCR